MLPSTNAYVQWSGVSGMSSSIYRHLAGLAGQWLLEYRDVSETFEPGSSWERPRGDEARAVYIVVNSEGKCCYVGQTRPTRRRENVAAERLKQHLREPSKRESWACYWVIPLRPDTPDSIVDQLEKRVALRLVIPLRHKKLAM
jgi:hypothetical protein